MNVINIDRDNKSMEMEKGYFINGLESAKNHYDKKDDDCPTDKTSVPLTFIKNIASTKSLQVIDNDSKKADNDEDLTKRRMSRYSIKGNTLNESHMDMASTNKSQKNLFTIKRNNSFSTIGNVNKDSKNTTINEGFLANRDKNHQKQLLLKQIQGKDLVKKKNGVWDFGWNKRRFEYKQSNFNPKKELTINDVFKEIVKTSAINDDNTQEKKLPGITNDKMISAFDSMNELKEIVL